MTQNSRQSNTFILGLLTLSVVTALLGSCKEKVEITDSLEVGLLSGECLETVRPMFLIRRLRDEVLFEEVTRVRLVPPEGVYAAYTVADYLSGEYEPDQAVEVLGIVSDGTRFIVDSVWSLVWFEGKMLAVAGRCVDAGYDGVTINLDSLLDEGWLLALADGSLSDVERERLGGRSPLDSKFARFCR